MTEPADDRLTPEDPEDSRITLPSLPPFDASPANDSDPPPLLVSAHRGSASVRAVEWLLDRIDAVAVAGLRRPELLRSVGLGAVGFVVVLVQCAAWAVLADVLGAAWYYGRSEGVAGLASVACSGASIGGFLVAVGFLWRRR